MIADSPRWPGATVNGTVTEDLIRRLAGAGHWSRGVSSEAMIVTYVRARPLDVADPREFVLRPAQAWTLEPGVTFGFGRAPDRLKLPLDVVHRLVDGGGELDTQIPRLAGRLAYEQGLWRLTTHATGGSTVTVAAPGMQVQISNSSPTYAIRSRRLLITLWATDSSDGRPIEHRFSLYSPRISDDAGQLRAQATSPEWTAPIDRGNDLSRDQRRLVAAWAYPELIGLSTQGFRRGLLTRRLLQQPLTGDDPNERILSTLRRNVAASLNTVLTGESGTPQLLAHFVQQRRSFGLELAQLHSEYDRLHPA